MARSLVYLRTRIKNCRRCGPPATNLMVHPLQTLSCVNPFPICPHRKWSAVTPCDVVYWDFWDTANDAGWVKCRKFNSPTRDRAESAQDDLAASFAIAPKCFYVRGVHWSFHTVLRLTFTSDASIPICVGCTRLDLGVITSPLQTGVMKDIRKGVSRR